MERCINWGVTGRIQENQNDIPADRQTPYDQWLADSDGAKLGVLRQNVSGAALIYSHFFEQAYKGYAFAGTLLTEFDNTAYQLPAKAPDG